MKEYLQQLLVRKQRNVSVCKRDVKIKRNGERDRESGRKRGR